MPRKSSALLDNQDVRDKILTTASELFYQHGIRAVGVDLIVEKAQVAKTSLYRYFKTKDDLIVAFLEDRDANFWKLWDRAAIKHSDDGEAELFAQLDWIGEMAGQASYRGCPQINIAAEYADLDHPARLFAKNHKYELRKRLKAIGEKIGVAKPDDFAGEIALLINGACVSTPMYKNASEARKFLQAIASGLLLAAKSKK